MVKFVDWNGNKLPNYLADTDRSIKAKGKRVKQIGDAIGGGKIITAKDLRKAKRERRKLDREIRQLKRDRKRAQ